MRGPEDRISSSGAIEKYNGGYKYAVRDILKLEPSEVIIPPPKKMRDFLDNIGKPHGPETLTIELEVDEPLNVETISDQINKTIDEKF